MPIVSAVGVAVHRTGGNEERAKMTEKVMSDAVLAARAAGITDHDEITRLMIEARDNLRKELGEA